MTSALARLGTVIARHPWPVIGAWTLIGIAASFGARELPALARGGSGVLDDSAAQRVGAELNRAFADPWVDPLALAVASDAYQRGDPHLTSVLACSQQTLAARDEVRKVTRLEDAAGRPVPRPAYEALLIALRADDLEAQERAVPVLRAALRPCREAFERLDPHGRFALTGRAAYTVDLNAANKQSGDRAEAGVLPLTLLILLLVFGSLPAAMLPLLVGLASTTVALALADALSRLVPVSNLTANVVTMLGLALGIDYSLLLVSRFRELARTRSREAALALTLASAGRVVVWSGLTVSIALLGLLWSPLLETRGVGIGGALVALVSVVAALTLLPACLALSASWLHRLRLRSPLGHGRAASVFGKLATRVVRRPFGTALIASAAVLLIALPAVTARSGYSNDPAFFPPAMEARIGGEILAALGHGTDALAIYLLVRPADGGSVVDAAHLRGLVALTAQLRADPRVAQLTSLADALPHSAEADMALQSAGLDAALARDPAAGARWLSRDRSTALVLVIPAAGLSLADMQALAQDLGRPATRGALRIDVGGAPAYFNDFDRSLARCYPYVAGFILLATVALLFGAFRSWLIPVKAVLMNLLAVAAAVGVVVAVFQWGWGKALVGLGAPLEAIPPTVPLMIFCLSFGISMDYELFMLFQIAGAYRRHGDTPRATVAGIRRAGPVITGAALIMAVVFAAFIGSDVQLMKMLGLGLTTAVIVDALVIRTLLLPAAMTLAGRWNWYPGDGRAPGAAPR
jgi:putative drug exporter of the RND superfamily